MPNSAGTNSQMRIYDHQGRRLYLTNEERAAFLDASKTESRENRMYCRALHDTGCRPTEALELEYNLVFRSLKKRKYDMRGNLKEPEYREVPVSEDMIDMIDLTFDIKKRQNNQRMTNKPLWAMSRVTAWRMVNRVMARAGIKGPQATCKGLRRGIGIALLVGEKPAPIHIVSQVLGHSDTKTTEIYLQATGIEKRQLIMQALEK